MTNKNTISKTLYDKLWDAHVVQTRPDGSALLYVDRHIVHEVTSPQAFEGLRLANRKPWRVGSVLATPDHNVSTEKNQRLGGYEALSDTTSRIQLQALDNNCDQFGVAEYKLGDLRQGIVHVIGPESGAVLPGMTVVCGDSHTSTNGALACYASGIGTSEVEHVLASQCLVTQKMKNMQIVVNGKLGFGVTPKDVVLAIIGKIGTAGGNGFAIEFTGEVFSNMSIEGRMTVCNMSIEAGARVGMVAVDDKTIDYVKGRDFAPKGEHWVQALAYWQTLHSDKNAVFDARVELRGEDIEPQITWGTSPEMVVGVSGHVPDPATAADDTIKTGQQTALKYMGLTENTAMSGIAIDKVFIGSCTNSRIEDMRAAAAVVSTQLAKGLKKSDTVTQALVVPGSGLVKKQAEAEGLHDIFIEAGFEWREPGCSMCLAMNADKLEAGERCASTSNRNFEGRQGSGGRTHLVSPEMAAAAAIAGHFVDVRTMMED